MHRIGFAMAALALAGCALVTISDPYGNRYGDWYNHGDQYRWQLDLCERRMVSEDIPPFKRKAAMRCCMAENGVPVDVPARCPMTAMP